MYVSNTHCIILVAHHSDHLLLFSQTANRKSMHEFENFPDLVSAGGACGPQAWYSRALIRAWGELSLFLSHRCANNLTDQTLQS